LCTPPPVINFDQVEHNIVKKTGEDQFLFLALFQRIGRTLQDMPPVAGVKRYLKKSTNVGFSGFGSSFFRSPSALPSGKGPLNRSPVPNRTFSSFAAVSGSRLFIMWS